MVEIYRFSFLGSTVLNDIQVEVDKFSGAFGADGRDGVRQLHSKINIRGHPLHPSHPC